MTILLAIHNFKSSSSPAHWMPAHAKHSFDSGIIS